MDLICFIEARSQASWGGKFFAYHTLVFGISSAVYAFQLLSVAVTRGCIRRWRAANIICFDPPSLLDLAQTPPRRLPSRAQASEDDHDAAQHDMLTKLIATTKLTCQLLQSALGLLNFIALVLPAGKPYLSASYAQLKQLGPNPPHPAYASLHLPRDRGTHQPILLWNCYVTAAPALQIRPTHVPRKLSKRKYDGCASLRTSPTIDRISAGAEPSIFKNATDNRAIRGGLTRS
eukprot:COSAG02_NODE_168_length_31711_cov_68.337973_27_plen_233_part_00